MTEIPSSDNSRQICPNCKNPIIRGTKFCESCGAKVEMLPQCTHCGAPNINATKFCESCGSPLFEVIEKIPSPDPAEVISPLPPQPSEYLPVMTDTPEKVTEILPSGPVLRESSVLLPGEETPKKPDEKIIPGPEPVPNPVPESVQKIPQPKEQPSSSPMPVPKTPLPMMTLAIIGIVILIVLAMGAYVVVLPMLSGTGTTQLSGSGAPVTTLPSASSPSSNGQGTVPVTVTLTPGQTQVPPANLAVTFQAERDALSDIVTVTFSGGAGQNGVKDVLFRLTRSDGQVLQKSFTITQIGRSESLQGTKMTDRVEVIAYYYNGEQYKILDQIFEYKKRG